MKSEKFACITPACSSPYAQGRVLLKHLLRIAEVLQAQVRGTSTMIPDSAPNHDRLPILTTFDDGGGGWILPRPDPWSFWRFWACFTVNSFSFVNTVLVPTVDGIDEAVRVCSCSSGDELELVAFEYELFFGYSMHWRVTDIDVTSDFSHGDLRIWIHSLFDDFPDSCVFAVRFLLNADSSDLWPRFLNWRIAVETVDWRTPSKCTMSRSRFPWDEASKSKRDGSTSWEKL